MFGLLVLGGCDDFGLHPGIVGRVTDMRPPPVTVVEGGPSGQLISGPFIADVPEGDVDRVVGSELHNWLTFEERQSLASASQRAAVAPTAAAIAWQSHDGGNEVTATGSAIALNDVYRSLGGAICRDVWQSVAKNGVSRSETVALCRETIASGIVLWVAAAG